MIVKLLTEHQLMFLSLKGGCKGLPESIHVKMPHCWKSHVIGADKECVMENCFSFFSTKAYVEGPICGYSKELFH